MNKITASAPGKVLLFGEHSVVYKKPAIAIAINKRAYVTVEKIDNERIIVNTPDLNLEHTYDINETNIKKDQTYPIYFLTNMLLANTNYNKGLKVTINSDIPIGGGLGSSAAVSVATAFAVSKILDLDHDRTQISKIAYESEKILHGTPSGIDNTISTWGGALKFKAGTIERLQIKDTPPLIVVNTKISRSTKKLVKKVRTLYERNPDVISHIFDAMENIAEKGKDYLIEGNWKRIGELMNINQGLLAAIGVSNQIIENILAIAINHGALGAKLTGAGGGGCLIILTEKRNQDKILKELQNQNIEIIPTTITLQGVREEKFN